MTTRNRVELGKPTHIGGIAQGIPYRAIPDKIRALEPFQGRSISGAHDAHGVYVIRSYRTPIAARYPDGTVDIIARNAWGPVTGRHINLCRAYLR